MFYMYVEAANCLGANGIPSDGGTHQRHRCIRTSLINQLLTSRGVWKQIGTDAVKELTARCWQPWQSAGKIKGRSVDRYRYCKHGTEPDTRPLRLRPCFYPRPSFGTNDYTKHHSLLIITEESHWITLKKTKPYFKYYLSVITDSSIDMTAIYIWIFTIRWTKVNKYLLFWDILWVAKLLHHCITMWIEFVLRTYIGNIKNPGLVSFRRTGNGL